MDSYMVWKKWTVCHVHFAGMLAKFLTQVHLTILRTVGSRLSALVPPCTPHRNKRLTKWIFGLILKLAVQLKISGQNRLKMHSVCREKTALSKQNTLIITVAQMCVKSTMQHYSVSMSIHVTVPRNNINQTNRNPAFMSVHDLKTHKSTHAHVYTLPTGQYRADIWFCGSVTTLAVNVFTETACLHYCRAHASPMKEHCLELFFQHRTGKLQVIYAKFIHGHVTSLWKCHHFKSNI